MKSYDSGKYAELMARIYFRIKGYRILKKNHKGRLKMPAGEVDFIATKNKTVIFVEVKKRQTITKARYAIKPAQQKRIINAAKLFIKQNPCFQNYNIRFDAVLVQFPFKIVHILNAWQE
ncbi:MAG: YraN family protein [Alphaproteobacteria bacterium]|nr:YraN family protein [Alphaproteobacteria bacterium]